ncbi:MAG: hypothetical protein NTX50_04630, partial [Candidatus Sumerlaeota bacterium]|nr:hypothetical protein [Candidatus Sumerlaeota bacterium]
DIACLAKEESGYTARPAPSSAAANAAAALWGPPGGDAKGRAVALTRYVICCVLGFMLTMFVFSNVIQNKAGHPRYYSSITGELCLGYVAIAFLIRKAWLRWLYTGLVLVCVLLVTSGWLITRGDGMRDSLQYIEAHRKPSEPVIGTFKISTQAAYHYYAPEAYKTVFSSFDRESTDTVQLITMLLEKMNATPGGTVWLLLHHWRNSPIFQRKPTDVVQEPCFKILEQQDIRGTAILHLQRAASQTSNVK